MRWQIPQHARTAQRRETSQKFQRVSMNLVDQGKVLTATATAIRCLVTASQQSGRNAF